MGIVQENNELGRNTLLHWEIFAPVCTIILLYWWLDNTQVIWCLIPATPNGDKPIEFIQKIPEIPEGAFAGGQSGQRRKDLLQDQLPMLLITWEHLEAGNNKAVNLYHHSFAHMLG